MLHELTVLCGLQVRNSPKLSYNSHNCSCIQHNAIFSFSGNSDASKKKNNCESEHF